MHNYGRTELFMSLVEGEMDLVNRVGVIEAKIDRLCEELSTKRDI